MCWMMMKSNNEGDVDSIHIPLPVGTFGSAAIENNENL